MVSRIVFRIVAVMAVAVGAFAQAKAPFDPTETLTVAFVIERNATVIDIGGPWQVFNDVMLTKSGRFFDPKRDTFNDVIKPFRIITVSHARELVTAGDGKNPLNLMPDYTYDDAPVPDVIVVPAEDRNVPARDAWLKKFSPKANVTMSVCIGAYILAKAGLLDGKRATTHHAFQDDLAKTYPKIRVVKGVRFVDNGNIATSAGLSSGIDLALRVVQRYYGTSIAQATADWIEYKGTNWQDSGMKH